MDSMAKNFIINMSLQNGVRDVEIATQNPLTMIPRVCPTEAMIRMDRGVLQTRTESVSPRFLRMLIFEIWLNLLHLSRHVLWPCLDHRGRTFKKELEKKVGRSQLPKIPSKKPRNSTQLQSNSNWMFVHVVKLRRRMARDICGQSKTMVQTALYNECFYNECTS